jgi:NAD(P)-dependent dehydrogenase (short-subunit alcohol dehydrogenase family)
MAESGARVTATGLTESELARFNAQGLPIDVCQLDVTQPREIARLFAGLQHLDAVINCAGTILRDGKEHQPEEFEYVVQVNLLGTMRVCLASRALLAASQGCVVNVASMLSFFGSGGAPGYSASKGGVVQLTKSLAIAWAADKIRVNAVAPGWIETPLTKPLVEDPATRQRIIDRTPLGRWGRPEDVVGAVQFLCSPGAAFITGVTLPVDGGYLIA